MDAGDDSSVTICMAVRGMDAEVRGLTGAVLTPFVHSSEVDCQEAVSEELALSRQVVSIHIKVPVGNN